MNLLAYTFTHTPPEKCHTTSQLFPIYVKSCYDQTNIIITCWIFWQCITKPPHVVEFKSCKHEELSMWFLPQWKYQCKGARQVEAYKFQEMCVCDPIEKIWTTVLVVYNVSWLEKDMFFAKFELVPDKEENIVSARVGWVRCLNSTRTQNLAIWGFTPKNPRGAPDSVL